MGPWPFTPNAVVAAAGPDRWDSSFMVNNVCSLCASLRQQHLVHVCVRVGSCKGSIARAKEAQHLVPKPQPSVQSEIEEA